MPETLFLTPELAVALPERLGYAEALTRAFVFLRRHGEGRYSDQTLMAIQRAMDAETEHFYEGEPRYFTPADLNNLPAVMSLDLPPHYDPDTEVKTGGPVAMLVLLPSGDCARMVLAVHSGHRRVGLGRRLSRELNTRYSQAEVPVVSWVGSGNAPGVHFLTAMGYTVTGMNGTGSLRFSQRGRSLHE